MDNARLKIQDSIFKIKNKDQ